MNGNLKGKNPILSSSIFLKLKWHLESKWLRVILFPLVFKELNHTEMFIQIIKIHACLTKGKGGVYTEQFPLASCSSSAVGSDAPLSVTMVTILYLFSLQFP